jgi:uncharacterized protein involved in type VI secretion and phage assembly
MRTVQLGAGDSRGAMILPEVGDEVLVAFEYGDVHQGYVVGGLYNGVDKPKKGTVDAVDGSGKVQRRSFHSRTNHRLEMLEASTGENAVQIITGDDKLKLSLDAKETKITVHSDGSVTIEAKNGVKVDAGTGKLEMTGQQLSLKAQSGITIDGGAGNVAMSSNGPVSVKGATVSVEGQAQTEVKGGAMCSISAALVRIN